MIRTTLTVVALFAVSIAASGQPPKVIRSTNAPVWGNGPRLVHEVRIGTLDGADEYTFASVADVTVNKAGHIFVADGGAKPVIRQYDASGKFVRNIGRVGAGPGEYRDLGGIGAFGDANLAVWDNRLQRLTTYGADGKRIAATRVPSGLFSSEIFRISPSGDSYVKTVVRVDPVSKEFSFGWIHVTADLRVADTILVPESPTAGAFVLPGAGGFDKPFRREVISTMTSRGELLTSDNDRLSFELRRKGTPSVRIERAFTPMKVTDPEHAEWTAWSNYTAEIAKPDRIKAGKPLLAAYVVPRTKPAFKELKSDSDGRIWVRRYVPAVSRPGPERKAGDKRPRRVWQEPATFDVFESNGTFLASVTLPWDAYFCDAVGMKVYVTVTGPDGDESVQRFRIEPSR